MVCMGTRVLGAHVGLPQPEDAGGGTYVMEHD